MDLKRRYVAREERQEEGIVGYCADNGIGFISYSPLAQELLTDKYLNHIPVGSRMSRQTSLPSSRLTPELREHLCFLNAQAAERGETLAEMALAWILAQRGVTSVLVGASSVEQMECNLRAIHSKPF